MFPVCHNVFGGSAIQTGYLRQEAGGGSVHIHANRIYAVLYNAAQSCIQFFLGTVVLILPDTDGLGVNFYQLCQRVLQPSRDGNGRAEIDIVIREFLCRKRGGGVNGCTGLIDNHIAGIGKAVEHFHGHCFRLPGGSAVTDGDVTHLMLAHQAA